MEEVSMVRILASGNSVRLSRKEFANFKNAMANSRIDFDAEAKKAAEMSKNIPNYSEKGYERLREIGKL